MYVILLGAALLHTYYQTSSNLFSQSICSKHRFDIFLYQVRFADQHYCLRTVQRTLIIYSPTVQIVAEVKHSMSSKLQGPKSEKRKIEESGREKSMCKHHQNRECSHVCMTCKIGICNVCVKPQTMGSHANHNLEKYDDIMADLEKKAKVQTTTYEEITKKTKALSDTADANFVIWKTSLKKAVEHRAREAVAQVEQWKADTLKQIQDLYREGTKQVNTFSTRGSSRGSSVSNMLPKLSQINMETWESFDTLKTAVDKMQSWLSVYSTASLVPKGAMSDKWTVDLGEIKGANMLEHLMGESVKGADMLEHLTSESVSVWVC